jgi:hypothetical protein
MARKTAEEQVERNKQIVVQRASGYTFSKIATLHGITPRQAQNIVKKSREDSDVEPITGTEAMIETIEQFERLIEEFAEFADSTIDQPHLRLGALNAKKKAFLEKIELEQAMGLLPHKLALTQAHDFAVFLNEAVAETIHRLKLAAPLDVLEPLDDALAKLEGNAESWRLHQAYPRIQADAASRQAERELAVEHRRRGDGYANSHVDEAPSVESD